VDPRRIVLLGGSQGGWVGPLAASRSAEVAAVSSLSGAGGSPDRQGAYRGEHMLRDAGTGEDQIADALAFFHHRAARLRRGDDLEEVLADQLSHQHAPWYPGLGDDGGGGHLAFMARIYDSDPAAVLARVTCPLLAIWGARDTYVPVAASAEAFAAGLGKAGNGSFRLEVVPDADHGLRLPATGGEERGPRIPDLMELLVSWLRRALPPGRGG